VKRLGCYQLISFGVDSMNVFQGAESTVMKHIHDDYAPYSIIVHCMGHRTNLVVQTLSMFPLVKHIENLL